MGRLVAKESTGTAVIGRTRGWTRSGLSSETLLADISAVRNCKVAERTVVWMIRWAMSIDKNLVTLVNRTLVSLDWSGVNSFTLRIGSGIWAAGTRRGRGVGRVAVEPDVGVAAMLTVLAGTVGVVAAAACSTPAGRD